MSFCAWIVTNHPHETPPISSSNHSGEWRRASRQNAGDAVLEMCVPGGPGVDEQHEMSDDDTMFELSLTASSAASSRSVSSVALRGHSCTSIGTKFVAQGQPGDFNHGEIHIQPPNSSPYDSHQEGSYVRSIEDVQPAGAGVRCPLPRQQSHLVGSNRSLSTETSPQIEDDGDIPHDVDADLSQLDLAVALLPLIPSYPPGTANILVRIRRVTPVAGVDFSTSPYVRISLHPGAEAIACTQRTHRNPIKDEQSATKYVPRDGAKLQSDSGRVFYDFGIAPDTRGFNAGCEILDSGNWGESVILKIGPEIMTRLEMGQGIPTLRLELVSGRSVGHCDLSLAEPLRRPCEVFQELNLPIWERDSHLTTSTKRMPHKSIDSRSSSIGYIRSPRNQNLNNESSLIAHLQFDFGVMLPDTTEHIRAENPAAHMTPTVLSKASITVEISAIRGCGTQAKFGPNPPGETRKYSDVIGVSIELSLEGERAYADIPSSSTSSIGGGEDMYSNLETTAENIRSVVLTCMRAEIEILTLRLTTRDDQEGFFSSENQRVSRGDAEGWLRYGGALIIPVSDINDIFDGRARWIAIDDPKTRDTASNVAEVSERAKRGSEMYRKVEIRLRIVASNVDHHPERHLQDASRASWHTPGDPNTANTPATSTRRLLNMRESHVQGLMSNSEHKIAVHTLPNCSRATATLSSMTSRAKTPRGNRPRLPTRAGHCAFHDPGPGFVDLEIITIQDQRMPSTSLPKNGSASQLRAKPSWRVRIELNGGINGDVAFESPEGILVSTLGSEPSPEGERGGDGVGKNNKVYWPSGAGVQARYSVHWTPRQRDLPCAAFTVLEGQVSTCI